MTPYTLLSINHRPAVKNFNSVSLELLGFSGFVRGRPPFFLVNGHWPMMKRSDLERIHNNGANYTQNGEGKQGEIPEGGGAEDRLRAVGGKIRGRKNGKR